MSVLKQILLVVSLFIFVGGAFPQNFKKIKKAGIEYQNGVPKSEEIMADDNEFNRVRICFGSSNDGHYNVIAFYHRGYYYNEIWGAINGSYSVAVYSTKIESSHPIDATHFNYATFPNKELISFCKKYGIKKLYFYKSPSRDGERLNTFKLNEL